MLRIRADLEAIGRATADDLGPWLQQAIELEHATIPPYLTALYSIKPGYNHAAATILRSVVSEEMLHMAIVANLLTALGGHPVLDKPGFIPVFPGPLPRGVQAGLTVGLAKLTRRLARDIFMKIEEPEDPSQYRSAAETGVITIGQFYGAIKERIKVLGPKAFKGKVRHQVVEPAWFSENQLFAIRNVEQAERAIDLIVRQGEGTPRGVRDEVDAGHFREFKQIAVGRQVAWNLDRRRCVFTDIPVGLDPAGVWNLYPNAKIVKYREGSRARVLAEQFNAGYTNLLRSLQATFNGKPETLKAAMGLMQELHLTARSLVSTQVPGSSLHASPTFEYTPVHV